MVLYLSQFYLRVSGCNDQDKNLSSSISHSKLLPNKPHRTSIEKSVRTLKPEQHPEKLLLSVWWIEHYDRPSFPANSSGKRSITSKVSCYRKRKKKCSSPSWQCNGSFWFTNTRKIWFFEWDILSNSAFLSDMKPRGLHLFL